MKVTKDVEEVKNTVKQLDLINIYRLFPCNIIFQCTRNIMKVHQILGYRFKTNLTNVKMNWNHAKLSFQHDCGLTQGYASRKYHHSLHTVVREREGEIDFIKIIQPVIKQVNKQIAIARPREGDQHTELPQCYVRYSVSNKRIIKHAKKQGSMTNTPEKKRKKATRTAWEKLEVRFNRKILQIIRYKYIQELKEGCD